MECDKCSKIREYFKNSPYNEDLKKRLENNIKIDLKKKGYFNPEISFYYEKNLLKIKVNEGKRAYVDSLNILSSNKIKINELNELKGKPFIEDKILKEIKKNEKKYLKEYPLLKISIKDKVFNNDKIFLEILVKDDEKIKFVFNENIKRKEKNKIIKKIISENTGFETIPFILEDMKEELSKKGYRNANFSYERKKIGDIENLFISFDKGEKFYISEIIFSGNLSFSSDEILKNSNLKIGNTYDFSDVNNFQDYIKYFFWERGFWDVNVILKEELSNKNKVKLKVLINEGSPLFCEEIVIDGIPEDIILPELNVKKNSPISRSVVQNDLQNIQRVLNDSGYYYAKVSFEIKEKVLYYRIEAGEKFKINKIIYRGLNNIKLDQIKSEINVKEKIPYSFKNLMDLQANIFSTSFFSSVNINPSFNLDEENTVNLHARLKEAPPMTYSYGIGYDSHDKFRLQFAFSDINFLKKRYILSFEGRLSSEQQMWRLSVKDPTFLNSNFPLFLGTYRNIERRPSFSLRRWGSLVEITKNLGKRTQATLRYDYQIQIPFDVEENFPIPKEEQEKKVSSISFIYLNDNRDDIFFPKEGSFFTCEIKYSYPFLFADTHFLKTILQFSYNLTPLKNTTFAFSSRIGYIRNYKKEEIPIGERLFLGGRNTLRAYSRDSVGIENDTVINGIPLGGKMSFLLNLEGRQFLSKSFGMNIFTDFGQVFSSSQEFDLKELAGGYGLGVFFLTPAGPLRIEISKKFESVFWDDDYQWYFSLGFPF